jgi:uncharacterized protein with GYD domain
MPKFLFKAKYATEGVRGVIREGGTGRKRAIEQLFAESGGELDGLYFAFGDADVYAIGDLPDNETAAGIAMTINADGRTSVETVVLLTPEEVDAAARAHVEYHAPGA